ncbi:hypothetical protein [Novosphingobium sp.]|uniref:hypothetical protein n=1 Tax=Novosphingobium sp. TaxID=1874826 RepID=UPI00352A6A60
MAIEALTSDRRGFLSAGAALAAAAPIAAAGAVNIYGPGLRAQWDAAMRACAEAKANAVAQNYLNGTGDVLAQAESVLLDMPAPDHRAVEWKMRWWQTFSEDMILEPKDFDAMLVDLARLATTKGVA